MGETPGHATCSFFQRQLLVICGNQKMAIYRSYNKLRYFKAEKNDNFQVKNCDIFLIFAQNIVCGYTLEPPQLGGSNEYLHSMF